MWALNPDWQIKGVLLGESKNVNCPQSRGNAQLLFPMGQHLLKSHHHTVNQESTSKSDGSGNVGELWN